MKRFVPIIAILICSMSISYSNSSDVKVVVDPIADYFQDVSGQIAATDIEYVRLIRIILDFNNDGIEDMAVSGSNAWGNAGGEWRLYFGGEDGRFVSFNQMLFFHPLAINVEPINKGTSKIIIYHRNSAVEGNLIEYQLSLESLKTISTKTIKPQEKYKDEYERLFNRLYKEPISEFCILSDYLRNRTCKWKRGYY